jgi:hypothetical protein
MKWSMDWIDFVKDSNRLWALVKAIMNLGSIKCGEFLE